MRAQGVMVRSVIACTTLDKDKVPQAPWYCLLVERLAKLRGHILLQDTAYQERRKRNGRPSRSPAVR